MLAGSPPAPRAQRLPSGAGRGGWMEWARQVPQVDRALARGTIERAIDERSGTAWKEGQALSRGHYGE